MDVRMPVLDGVEATRQITARVPRTAVLVLTMYEDDATVFTAMQAGARGYLLKDVGQDELAAAIRSVAAGQAIFGPGVASRVLAQVTSGAASSGSPTPSFPELTQRERAVLELLATGLRTAAIAERLFLSPKTVSNHMTSIFAKLQVTDRAAAMIRAREGGLGT
jgi:DNA-binding NarL/FixJ family response regulator